MKRRCFSDRNGIYSPYMADTTPKQMRITLTDEQWRKLRLAAADRDTSMQALVAHWIALELTTEPDYG